MAKAERIGDGPIIEHGMHPSLGDNINGPSLVRRPAWCPGPGRWMLYFAHHKGQHIRLAFANDPAGPWTVHPPGVLPLSETPLAQTRPDTPQPAWAREAGQDGLYPHLASPDVWVDDTSEEFRMLFHGLAPDGEQVSYEASSRDGLDWQVEGPPIAETYLRRFTHAGQDYAMARLGVLMRQHPDAGWQIGPTPFTGALRHVAVLVEGDTLHVVFSRIGDAPERLIHTTLDLTRPWPDWRTGPERELLRPAMSWEGANEPNCPSVAGAVGFANELRDPDLTQDGENVWLVYSGGGEAALGFARLIPDPEVLEGA